MKQKVQQPGIKVRVQAARVLLAVTQDYQQLDDALECHAGDLNAQDAALLQAMCYGVMRHYLELLFWLNQFSKRPVKDLQPTVRVLILVGLYQLKYMRVAAHAAIHTTVESAAHIKASRAKGLINAVLRGFQRSYSAELESRLSTNEEACNSHPSWMLERFKKDWPHHWQQVVNANNEQAPMIVRVDLNQTKLESYLSQLEKAGIEANQHPVARAALVLSKPVDVSLLPGFDKGVVSVQDAAAQLAVPLLQHNSQHSVLDACAAPGGKTAHILQLNKPRYLLALDTSESRLLRVKHVLQRIHAEADIAHGDASVPSTWWDGKLFDRILLDVPCSASGVIRRHPDIKYLRSEGALKKIVKRQKKILDSMWQLLKPGGQLLYVTCSVFKVENEEQVSAFLQRHDDAELFSMPDTWGRGKIGRQVLPGDEGMDGFYFALLGKGT